MLEFSCDDKKITLFEGEPHSPLIYINAYSDCAHTLYALLKAQSTKSFSLAVINNLQWNAELSPWPHPALYKGESAFLGHADNYLDFLTHKLIPKSESFLQKPPSERYLAGYSLAGLFALYTLFKSPLFTKVASISGSLWYAGFIDYAKSHAVVNTKKSVYLSLGDREKDCKQRLLREVEACTLAFAQLLEEKHIHAIFEKNAGTHFQDQLERTVKALVWLLEN
jgi:predicted alpha/beta superfamily hydrolase